MRSSLGRLVTFLIVIVVTTTAGLIAVKQVDCVVTDGVSMNPTYYEGDFVVAARDNAYDIGDIVAYSSERSHGVAPDHRWGH